MGHLFRVTRYFWWNGVLGCVKRIFSRNHRILMMAEKIRYQVLAKNWLVPQKLRGVEFYLNYVINQPHSQPKCWWGLFLAVTLVCHELHEKEESHASVENSAKSQNPKDVKVMRWAK
jgi:hypothetical protein